MGLNEQLNCRVRDDVLAFVYRHCLSLLPFHERIHVTLFPVKRLVSSYSD